MLHQLPHHDFILAHAAPQAPPLVPELKLHLAKDARGVFEAADHYMDGRLGARPYWAFAWPGGQALARYILDSPDIVAGKIVVDIGAGSGLGAIAAASCGAGSVTAADIDPLAITACRLNARLNEVNLQTSTNDPLRVLPDCDVVLIGDLAYDADLQLRVAQILSDLHAAGTRVLFADRTTARRPGPDLVPMAEFEAPLCPPLVEDFVERARVWEFTP